MDKRTKFNLDEEEIPTHWYNIQADLPELLPPLLDALTKEPVAPGSKAWEALTKSTSMEILKQEMSTERWIEIPEELRDIYRLWRPTILYRAHRLEKFLDTPAKIFYKYEGSSPSGSHKLNDAVAEAYYCKADGMKRMTTSTGAGQWGSAVAFACALFGLECKIYMVRVSYEQKPYRRIAMETWGARCIPSPSLDTKVGRDARARLGDDCPGSLGIALGEAQEDAETHDDTYHSHGSVLNHVLLHQTVIGLEAKKQMEMADAYPDIIVGCIGGGSNFAGLFLPFLKDKIEGTHQDLRIINCEPEAVPCMTRGVYAYDYAMEGLPVLAKMYTLGLAFIPPPIHTGGLRYHGLAPIICKAYQLGLVEARAMRQNDTFKAGVDFARTEGIISGPEPSHCLKVGIDEALKCKESGEAKTILIAHSGHGHFDLAAYDAYLSGKLKDYSVSEEELRKSLAELPKVPAEHK